jgi:hypothetical protein
MPLSASLAQVGPTILVLLQTDSPIPGWLGLEPGAGLSEYLSGEARLADVARPVTSVPNLFVVTPGLDASSLRRLLASAEGGERLVAMRESANYVVLDSPNVTRVALSQSLVRRADVVILAAENGRTDVRSLVAAASEVERFDGAMGGVVLAPRVKRSWRPPVAFPTAEDSTPGVGPRSQKRRSSPTEEPATAPTEPDEPQQSARSAMPEASAKPR